MQNLVARHLARFVARFVARPVALACALASLLALSACETPRGAGLRSEVLAVQQDSSSDPSVAVADFAVFSVTRASLPALQAWPRAGPGEGNWITRTEQPASLIIAPGDTLKVTVWDADDNSLLAGAGQRAAQLQDVLVSSGGVVFLPFVGDVRVSGMSPQSARDRIQELYADSSPSAQVQVQVTPGRGNTVSLVSGVTAPGVYPLADRDVTLLNILSEGGGVRPGLVNPQVQLLRANSVYRTSLARLYDTPSLDTTLVGGDRIVVGEDERYFLSLGAAGSEALHVFPKDRVTALDALSIIGGINDTRANPQGILILRDYPRSALRADLAAGPPQDRVVFTVDLTTADGLFSAGAFQIQSGDLVYATESPVTAANTILGLFGTAIGIASRL
jgi:polysaccharide export outer membrane protein